MVRETPDTKENRQFIAWLNAKLGRLADDAHKKANRLDLHEVDFGRAAVMCLADCIQGILLGTVKDPEETVVLLRILDRITGRVTDDIGDMEPKGSA